MDVIQLLHREMERLDYILDSILLGSIVRTIEKSLCDYVISYGEKRIVTLTSYNVCISTQIRNSQFLTTQAAREFAIWFNGQNYPWFWKSVQWSHMPFSHTVPTHRPTLVTVIPLQVEMRQNLRIINQAKTQKHTHTSRFHPQRQEKESPCHSPSGKLPSRILNNPLARKPGALISLSLSPSLPLSVCLSLALVVRRE